MSYRLKRRRALSPADGRARSNPLSRRCHFLLLNLFSVAFERALLPPPMLLLRRGDIVLALHVPVHCVDPQIRMDLWQITNPKVYAIRTGGARERVWLAQIDWISVETASISADGRVAKTVASAGFGSAEARRARAMHATQSASLCAWWRVVPASSTCARASGPCRPSRRGAKESRI